MKITFKLRPRETGLRAVGAGPRASEIRLDGRQIGSVSAVGGGWRGPIKGWMWVVYGGEPLPDSPFVNTSHRLVATADEAKRAAKAWILSEMKRGARKEVG